AVAAARPLRAAGAAGTAVTADRGRGTPARTAGAYRATRTGRARGTGRMTWIRGAAGAHRTDRRQVGPRRRLLIVAVGPVGPGQPTRRREILLGHGAPPDSGVRYVTARYAEL